MQIDQLRSYLDDEAKAASWFRSLGIVDARRAHANLVNMATVGLTLDLLANLADQLASICPPPAIRIGRSTISTDSWPRPAAPSRSARSSSATARRYRCCCKSSPPVST